MRIFRELTKETKIRISNAMRGRTLSENHKKAISNSMREYWKRIPYQDINNNED